MVSKKSTSRMEKSSGSSWGTNAARRSAFPKVSNRGTAIHAPWGRWATPSKSASTVEKAMPMRSAPRTRRASRAAVTTSPTRATSVSGSRSEPKVTGGSTARGARDSAATVLAGTTTTRAFTAPMNAMNSPMPAPMARRRSRGIACSSASRRPTSTRTSMSSPSATTSPIAACHEPAAGAT